MRNGGQSNFHQGVGPVRACHLPRGLPEPVGAKKLPGARGRTVAHLISEQGLVWLDVLDAILSEKMETKAK
jgi:hypothetical protein